MCIAVRTERESRAVTRCVLRRSLLPSLSSHRGSLPSFGAGTEGKSGLTLPPLSLRGSTRLWMGLCLRRWRWRRRSLIASVLRVHHCNCTPPQCYSLRLSRVTNVLSCFTACLLLDVAGGSSTIHPSHSTARFLASIIVISQHSLTLFLSLPPSTTWHLSIAHSPCPSLSMIAFRESKRSQGLRTKTR